MYHQESESTKTKTIMTTTRTATKNDFKVGTTLITSEGYAFQITSHYAEGVWEARGRTGSTCVMECEARFYKVETL